MRIALVVLTIGIVAGLAWYGWHQRQDPMPPQPATAVSPAARSVDELPAMSAPLPPPYTAPARSDDRAASHEQRLAFHARVRSFFAQAPAMPAADRSREAQALAIAIAEYESRGELSAAEALLLKAALIRESVTDPAAQTEQIAALERSYRAQTDRRRESFAAQRDPMFELYKLREAAIVTNVMAMTQIPGGLSRDEYLRQRLQQERELLLDGGSN